MLFVTAILLSCRKYNARLFQSRDDEGYLQTMNLGLAREGSRSKRVPRGNPPTQQAGLHFHPMSKRSLQARSGLVGPSTLPVRRGNRVTSLLGRYDASFLVLGRAEVYTSL